MISKILVPTDGSKASKKAIDYAIDLSKQTKASVTILGVVDKSNFLAQAVPADAASIHLRRPIEDYLGKIVEDHLLNAEKQCRKKRVKPATVLRTGLPVEEIIKEARRSKSDIIIIGSHGKGTIESAVLGSVTYELLHKNTKYPVLVIRG
jgi:nucleotide-binding universal stress UspA family protein